MKTKTKPETDEDRAVRYERKFNELRDKYDDKVAIDLDGDKTDWSYACSSARNNAAESDHCRERCLDGTIEQHANFWAVAYQTLAMHEDQMVIL